jgi:hypothetical protein
MEEFPDLEREDLFERFKEAIRGDDEMMDCLAEYWFANNHRSLTRFRPSEAGVSKVVRAAVAQERRSTVEVLKEHIRARATEMALLDMMLPNGKMLRDCTAKECTDLSPKVGAWLAKIGKQIAPQAIVGKELSEESIRKLWKP